MLKDDFYTITSILIESDAITATLTINGAHKIFEGHFPGHPVVPGVCMMQMVKEITAIALEKDIQLIKAEELKFLQVIDPQENKEIKMLLQYNTVLEGEVKVSATLAREGATCFKFKGSFKANLPQQ